MKLNQPVMDALPSRVGASSYGLIEEYEMQHGNILADQIHSIATQARSGCGLSHDVFVANFSGMVDSTFPPGSHNRVQAVELARTIGDYATPDELAQAQKEMAAMGCCTHGLDPNYCPCGCGEL